MEYIIIDIETCPIKLEGYLELAETERKKLLNPIDSKVVAIGLRYNSKTVIIQDKNEKQMLEEFWKEMKEFIGKSLNKKIVGFNLKDFDLPFLVTRSFINNVKIFPFKIKEVIDLREKVSAFRYGFTRGKLKEFGEALGIELHEMDGSMVAEECIKGNIEKIKEYLKKDLEITEKMLKRIIETNIIEIERW
ncbi:ribonuclease H-like domain-containing protein [Candidatus Micrarchaeota archaeon]|nr:ribonuclease H-like domain-containing protein [Candidatus Micrarchaeota archaeon]MBU2476541.1 ribonuclease H-like domain-containing protein [Candidatus Micrarchaeota archaeon]